MKKALFPGTFDPPTLGHLDIIKRSRSVCDKLYVGVAANAAKSQGIFSTEEKIEMLQTICRPYPHVEVVS
ncbi:MAG: adenylyltransferase/cytidyltransferase family protein, partial [Chlamydiota bacterium]